ncbi:MAG TPA: MBL fold metallo-hydrolase [Hydrogenophaga sp.]|uniref:MBL fold metallo-hydrolase n=1 Tax=Hydrogenophaga sp. TaxID=1904254 RepID=UPI002BC72E23|nr:MBL fold metallo-hydrolase [Hydrogenophaga sp.]HMN92203.1 MBL fold metallo-hydrolase [Hydrogenophaga sp.]HMP11595.1 MBL fold metallo-hydrolase [Hydrogenophaga sp.]
MTPDRDALERQLHYPLGNQLPGEGQTLAVAPGVKWVRMGLPFALDHINLWLLRDQFDGIEGWTVVDCCIAHDSARAQWEQIFTRELEGLPVLRVVVTHMHPDHIGLAQWLCERWQAPLYISATDYHMARLGSQSTTGFGGEAAARHFARHGLNDPESQQRIRARAAYYPGLVPGVPGEFHRLLDGTVLRIGGRLWRCIAGHGHAPEHMALHCDELSVLISGDMVLPRISTNVSVYDQEPEADALALFLSSLERFLPLSADTLVLPSHGKPFVGLHERIGQLQGHHRDRLGEVMAACRDRACSALDIVPVLFPRPLDLHQTTFAMGEAIAHLHFLWHGGQLRRQADADGVFRFSAVGPS